MAFKKININENIRKTILVLLAFPWVVSSNIDCAGKAFHCVNSTHFMVCVDLGGASSTIDDFIIECPPTTQCHRTNYFECEFPSTTLAPTIDVSASSVVGPSEIKTVLEDIVVSTTLSDSISEVPLTEANTESVTLQPEVPVTTTSTVSTTLQPQSDTTNDFVTQITESTTTFPEYSTTEYTFTDNAIDTILTNQENNLNFVTAETVITSNTVVDIAVTEISSTLRDIDYSTVSYIEYIGLDKNAIKSENIYQPPTTETVAVTTITADTQSENVTNSDLIIPFNNITISSVTTVENDLIVEEPLGTEYLTGPVSPTTEYYTSTIINDIVNYTDPVENVKQEIQTKDTTTNNTLEITTADLGQSTTDAFTSETISLGSENTIAPTHFETTTVTSFPSNSTEIYDTVVNVTQNDGLITTNIVNNGSSPTNIGKPLVDASNIPVPVSSATQGAITFTEASTEIILLLDNNVTSTQNEATTVINYEIESTTITLETVYENLPLSNDINIPTVTNQGITETNRHIPTTANALVSTTEGASGLITIEDTLVNKDISLTISQTTIPPSNDVRSTLETFNDTVPQSNTEIIIENNKSVTENVATDIHKYDIQSTTIETTSELLPSYGENTLSNINIPTVTDQGITVTNQEMPTGTFLESTSESAFISNIKDSTNAQTTLAPNYESKTTLDTISFGVFNTEETSFSSDIFVKGGQPNLETNNNQEPTYSYPFNIEDTTVSSGITQTTEFFTENVPLSNTDKITISTSIPVSEAIFEPNFKIVTPTLDVTIDGAALYEVDSTSNTNQIDISNKQTGIESVQDIQTSTSTLQTMQKTFTTYPSDAEVATFSDTNRISTSDNNVVTDKEISNHTNKIQIATATETLTNGALIYDVHVTPNIGLVTNIATVTEANYVQQSGNNQEPTYSSPFNIEDTTIKSGITQTTEFFTENVPLSNTEKITISTSIPVNEAIFEPNYKIVTSTLDVTSDGAALYEVDSTSNTNQIDISTKQTEIESVQEIQTSTSIVQTMQKTFTTYPSNADAASFSNTNRISASDNNFVTDKEISNHTNKIQTATATNEALISDVQVTPNIGPVTNTAAIAEANYVATPALEYINTEYQTETESSIISHNNNLDELNNISQVNKYNTASNSETIAKNNELSNLKESNNTIAKYENISKEIIKTPGSDILNNTSNNELSGSNHEIFISVNDYSYIDLNGFREILINKATVKTVDTNTTLTNLSTENKNLISQDSSILGLPSEYDLQRVPSVTLKTTTNSSTSSDLESGLNPNAMSTQNNTHFDYSNSLQGSTSHQTYKSENVPSEPTIRINGYETKIVAKTVLSDTDKGETTFGPIYQMDSETIINEANKVLAYTTITDIHSVKSVNGIAVDILATEIYQTTEPINAVSSIQMNTSSIQLSNTSFDLVTDLNISDPTISPVELFERKDDYRNFSLDLEQETAQHNITAESRKSKYHFNSTTVADLSSTNNSDIFVQEVVKLSTGTYDDTIKDSNVNLRIISTQEVTPSDQLLPTNKAVISDVHNSATSHQEGTSESIKKGSEIYNVNIYTASDLENITDEITVTLLETQSASESDLRRQTPFLQNVSSLPIATESSLRGKIVAISENDKIIANQQTTPIQNMYDSIPVETTHAKNTPEPSIASQTTKTQTEEIRLNQLNISESLSENTEKQNAIRSSTPGLITPPSISLKEVITTKAQYVPHQSKLLSQSSLDIGSTTEKPQEKLAQSVVVTESSHHNTKIENELFSYCSNKGRGRYSDRSDCTKFYICIGKNEPIIGKCPVNTVFSELKKQCTKNLSHCTRGNEFKCISEGRFSDILKNNVYYICVKRNHNFLKFKFQCQNGYYLNKTEVKCRVNSQHPSTSIDKNSDETGSSESKNSKEVKDTKTKEHKKNESEEEFECKKEGKFRDPNNCKKYYVCSKNKKSEYRKRRKSCDSDERFHKDKKKCVDADSYDC